MLTSIFKKSLIVSVALLCCAASHAKQLNEQGTGKPEGQIPATTAQGGEGKSLTANPNPNPQAQNQGTQVPNQNMQAPAQGSQAPNQGMQAFSQNPEQSAGSMSKRQKRRMRFTETKKALNSQFRKKNYVKGEHGRFRSRFFSNFLLKLRQAIKDLKASSFLFDEDLRNVNATIRRMNPKQQNYLKQLKRQIVSAVEAVEWQREAMKKSGNLVVEQIRLYEEILKRMEEKNRRTGAFNQRREQPSLPVSSIRN